MAEGGSFKDSFRAHCVKPDAGMTTKDLTRWITDAGIMKKTGPWSSNNIDICFSKHKTKGKNVLTCDQAESVLKDIAKDDYENIRCKLCASKKEDHLKAKTSKTGGVDRMTDSSKYTGAHKERFDESGKGKGASGRADKADNTGYVGNYKGSGSFDKKH